MKNIFLFAILLCVCTSNCYSQNWLWAKSGKQTAGAGFDECNSVSADASGNVFITGTFFSPTLTFGSITLTNVNPSGSTSDVFIAKYDANGNVLWAKSVGGEGDVCNSISADASGNVFITGWFSCSSITFGSTTLTNTGGEDLFIAKYDAIGNVLWAKNAGGNSFFQHGYSVSADANGNVFVTGVFDSTTL